MWRFLVDARTVGGPLGGVELQVTTWDGGSSSVVRRPPVTLNPSTAFTIADSVRSVTLAFSHPRYAPLAFILERTPNETTWRWTNPVQSVVTAGQDVRIVATLVRVMHAPTAYMSEDEIVRRAKDAKEPLDRAAQQRHGAPPETIRVTTLRGMLVDKSGVIYRHSGSPQIKGFHQLDADPLGDPESDGWARFKSTVHDVAPWPVSRVHMFEYGEVGTAKDAPRFLVAVWLPNVMANLGYAPLDMLVWFTPNTNPPAYPAVDYPFRGDYPYALMALGGIAQNKKTKEYSSTPYIGAQRYGEVAFGHLHVAHNLAHHMLAAGRAAAIVVPIAPSANFQLWLSPSTLMRMLKEICRTIPRNDNDRIAKIHPAPPNLGRIGVAGFSAAGQRLNTLLNRAGPDPHYNDPVWGTAADAQEFDAAWRELWCIDGNFGTDHAAFIEKVATWVRQSDRKARIYKNDFTDGRFDPRDVRTGEFGRWVKAAKIDKPRSDKHWAISCADASRRLQVVSVSQEYMVAPASKELPLLEAGQGRTHENMPRVFFGHAAVTSGFRRLP